MKWRRPVGWRRNLKYYLYFSIRQTEIQFQQRDARNLSVLAVAKFIHGLADFLLGLFVPSPSGGGSPFFSCPGPGQFRIWRCRPGSRFAEAPGSGPSGLTFGPSFSISSFFRQEFPGAAKEYGCRAPPGKILGNVAV